MFRTLRLWDINNSKKHKSIIKPKTVQGRRAIPTTCTYSQEGRWIAAACQDGSIQIWDHNKLFVRRQLFFYLRYHWHLEDFCILWYLPVCWMLYYQPTKLVSKLSLDTCVMTPESWKCHSRSGWCSKRCIISFCLKVWQNVVTHGWWQTVPNCRPTENKNLPPGWCFHPR